MIVEICFVNHMRGRPMLWEIFFGGKSMQWNVRGLAEEKLFFLPSQKKLYGFMAVQSQPAVKMK